jgi:DNA polymerase-1
MLQVHDEIVLEVPEADKNKVAKFVKKTMEDIFTLSVPLVVDLEEGKNWGDLEPMK